MKNDPNSCAGQALAVDLGVHERGGEVVARVGQPVLAQLHGVAAYIAMLRRISASNSPPYSGSPTPRIMLVSAKICFSSVVGDAHHLADDLQRQGRGDLLDEVALAVRVLLQQASTIPSAFWRDVLARSG